MSKKIYNLSDLDLLGEQGNAFAIMAYVTEAMKESRMNGAGQWVKQAMARDYGRLLFESIVKIREINQQRRI